MVIKYKPKPDVCNTKAPYFEFCYRGRPSSKMSDQSTRRWARIDKELDWYLHPRRALK